MTRFALFAVMLVTIVLCAGSVAAQPEVSASLVEVFYPVDQEMLARFGADMVEETRVLCRTEPYSVTFDVMVGDAIETRTEMSTLGLYMPGFSVSPTVHVDCAALEVDESVSRVVVDGMQASCTFPFAVTEVADACTFQES